MTVKQPAQFVNYSTPSTDVENKNTSRNYHAYLLRIWREEESMPWRVQIEDPTTDETVGFPTLAELLSFLNGQFKEKQQEAPMN
ncbi:MAG TPA: hypothetical protein PLF42_18100 [Anaerolineales bacterium]|nr:hypothetical protein [Anaerolineales bacterium]